MLRILGGKLSVFCLSICLIFPASGFSQPLVGDQSRAALVQKLHQLLSHVKQQYHIHALSFSLLLPGQHKPIVLQLGNKLIGKPSKLNSNDLFQVGSITKTFTAALAMQAIAAGQLKANLKLKQLLPEYKHWGSVTIKQLLNQTSGIPDYDASSNWWQRLAAKPTRVWHSQQLVAIAYTMPRLFKPGQGWSYSNTNYVLLGMILQQVKHISLQKQFTQLMQQLALDNIYFLPEKYPANIAKRMVHGYFGKGIDQTNVNTSWLQSAGGVLANPAAIVVWYQRLFQQVSATQPFLTSKAIFSQTRNGQNTTDLSLTAYNIGVFRLNTPQGLLYFTPGLTPGYTSMVAYAPCSDAFFSYSAANEPLHKFHGIMLMRVMALLKHYHVGRRSKQPTYCHTLEPAAKFIFPKIG